MRGLTAKEYELLVDASDGVVPDVTDGQWYTDEEVRILDEMIARGLVEDRVAVDEDGAYGAIYPWTTALGREAMRVYEAVRASSGAPG